MLRVILFAGSLWLCCPASGMMNTFQSPLSGSDFRDCGPGYKSYCISREIHHIGAFPQHMHTLITFAPLHWCKWWEERVAKKKTGTPPTAATRNLTHERGWNISVRSKSCYERLKHEKWHEHDTGPTRSICLCSIWHLKISQENTVLLSSCSSSRSRGLLMLMSVRVHIMYSCAFVKRISEDHCDQTEAARKLFFCAGVQHLYFWHSFMPMKKIQLLSISPHFNSCHGREASEAAFRSSGDVKPPHRNPK